MYNFCHLQTAQRNTGITSMYLYLCEEKSSIEVHFYGGYMHALQFFPGVVLTDEQHYHIAENTVWPDRYDENGEKLKVVFAIYCAVLG